MSATASPLSQSSTLLLRALEEADAPVPLKALAKRLKLSAEELAPVLSSELERGTIHRWPELRKQRRFWRRSPDDVLRDSILRIAGELAMPAAALSKQTKKEMPGFPAKLIASAIQQLVREQALRKYPGFGRDKELLGRTGYLQAYDAAGQVAIRVIQDKLAAAGLNSAVVPTVDIGTTILETMSRMEPASTAPVSVRELRGALPQMDKAALDQAALKLRAQQKVFLSRHDFPQGLSEDDRNGLIDGQDGSYYVAITRRN